MCCHARTIPRDFLRKKTKITALLFDSVDEHNKIGILIEILVPCAGAFPGIIIIKFCL